MKTGYEHPTDGLGLLLAVTHEGARKETTFVYEEGNAHYWLSPTGTRWEVERKPAADTRDDLTRLLEARASQTPVANPWPVSQIVAYERGVAALAEPAVPANVLAGGV